MAISTHHIITNLNLYNTSINMVIVTESAANQYVAGQTSNNPASHGGTTLPCIIETIVHHKSLLDIPKSTTKKKRTAADVNTFIFIDLGSGDGSVLKYVAESTNASRVIGIESDKKRCEWSTSNTKGFDRVTVMEGTYVPVEAEYSTDDYMDYMKVLTGQTKTYLYYNNAESCMLDSRTNNVTEAPQVQLEREINSNHKILHVEGSTVVCLHPMNLNRDQWTCNVVEVREIPPMEAFSWMTRSVLKIYKYTRKGGSNGEKKPRHHLMRTPTETIDYKFDKAKNEGYFEVELLVNVRESGNGKEWKVRWAGYGPDYDTWVHEHDIASNADFGEYILLPLCLSTTWIISPYKSNICRGGNEAAPNKQEKLVIYIYCNLS